MKTKRHASSWTTLCVIVMLGRVAAAQPATAPATEPPAEPPAEPTEPPAATLPEPAPVVAAETPPPKNLAVGTEGIFRPGLLLQGWYVVNKVEGNDPTNTFRMRRAEISARGEILPKTIAYGVMIDPAKVLEPRDEEIEVENQDPPPTDPDAPELVTVNQPVSALSVFQDFFITFLTPYVDISVGQFKIPVSWEGYNSSSKLLFPERALVSREFGDRRDMGLRLAKTWKWWGYSAGIFNGTTLNALDTNNAKDAALRLEGYPIEGLIVAGVIYASVGERGENGTKDRYEADLRFERGPFLFQGEYIRSHDVGSSLAAVDGQGFYAALAYMIMGRIQPAVRAGLLDPNVDGDVDPATASGKDEVSHVEFGLNYYFLKHEAKLQGSFSRFAYDDRPVVYEGIAAAQVAF